MKMEKITDQKFKTFARQQIAYSQAVYGGYKGETSTGSQSDQIKGDSSVDYTGNPSGISNDGFK
jgi:hypothetical protein